ncbi:MAG: hypothetical protein WCX79_01230 [Candidatus Paceibacterota bacterium]|jgi:fatty acid-binding protein DegV
MMPDDIKIGGVRYKITPVDYKISESYGKTVFESASIHIDDTLSQDMSLATLLHEVIEVINEENELKLEHRAIQTLATQLFQVLKDNPEVFK